MLGLMRATPLLACALSLVLGGAAVAACIGDEPNAAPVDPGSSPGTTSEDGSSGVPPTSCTQNDQCPTGFCADGVCCASPCNGQCESCNEPGKEGQCIPVNGVPRGNRSACAGAGDPVCGGACDGTNRNACAYPTTECRAASCSDGVLTAAATCSEGACPAVATSACGDTTKTKYCSTASCVGVTQIAAGYNFTCALMSDETVRCWGDNASMQLGQGANDTERRPTPAPVPGLSGVTKIVATSLLGHRVCAILNDQTARCWGVGTYGVLGDGDTSVHSSGTPVTVLKAAGVPFTGIKDIAVGRNATCALDAMGVAWCWGNRTYGTVGDGVTSDTNRAYPVQVTGGGSGNSAIAMGKWHACLTTTSNNSSQVRCWGDNSSLGVGAVGEVSYNTAQTIGSFEIVNGALTAPVGAGGDRNVSCAILQNSSLACWGGNFYGQLGRNTVGVATNTAVPASVCRDANAPCALMNQVTSFGIGEQGSCAVTGGNVRCWGADNNVGLLGDGVMRTTANPVLNASVGPSLPTAARQVAVGGYHACALLADGTVRCWGWGHFGQLGNGGNSNSASPVTVAF
jgi:hypothetical protein